MVIEPMRDMVLVRLVATPKKAGRIKVVELEAQPSHEAMVEAVGPEVRDALVGQRVVVSRLQGMALDNNRILLPEAAILGYLE